MKDLERITVADCRDYFRTYYAPNNAVLCLTGAFDPQAARPLITGAFGDIPAQAPPTPIVESEDPQLGERRLEVELPPSSRLSSPLITWSGARTPTTGLRPPHQHPRLGESSRSIRRWSTTRVASTPSFLDGEHAGLFYLWVDDPEDTGGGRRRHRSVVAEPSPLG
jgi:hypothetical protein